MRPSFRNQLRFLADLYKNDDDQRRKHETTAKPQLNRLEDRTVLSSTLPDGYVVDLFYDGSYNNDVYTTLNGLTAGVNIINPADGAVVTAYQFPDTNSDGFADGFFSTDPYAPAYTSAHIAIDGDNVYLALNRSKSLFTTDGQTDILKIDAVNKTATKLGTYSFTTTELLVAADGSLVDVWSDFETTPGNPYGTTTNGVSQIDSTMGTAQELYEAPAGFFIQETLIGPDGRVYTLASKSGFAGGPFGSPQQDGLIVTAIDLATDKASTFAAKDAFGNDITFDANGDLIVGFTDSEFGPANPYGPTAVTHGVSRFDTAAASPAEQSLGSVTSANVNEARAIQSVPTKVEVGPTGDIFAEVGGFETVNSYGFGVDPNSTFYQATPNTFTEIATTKWRTDALTVDSDNQLVAQWTDELYSNGPYGPDFDGTVQGVSRIDPGTGVETELFETPSTTTNGPYGSFTTPDVTIVSSLPAPSGSDANYLGLNDFFQQNGVYDESTQIVAFNAGSNTPAPVATFDSRSFAFLVVSGNNDRPTVTGLSDQTVTAGGTATVSFTVADSETAAAGLTVTATSSDPMVTVTPGGTGATRTVTATTVATDSGPATITVTVTDANGASTVGTFVLNVNARPTITDPADQTIDGGTSTTFQVTVADTETAAGTLAVTATSSNPTLLPAGSLVVSGTGATRTITATPAANQMGSATITLTVTDASGATATQTVLLTVNDMNLPPTITDITNVTINVNTSTSALAFTVADSKTAATALTVTATSSNATLVPPGGLVLGGSGANRTLTVTPAAGQFGTATITVTVTDERGATVADTFVLTVNDNTRPTLSKLLPQTVRAGSVGTVSFTVADVETAASALTVTATSSNTSVLSSVTVGGSGANRVLTLSPALGRSGTATVTVTVTDGGGLTATDTFVVTVPESKGLGSAIGPNFGIGGAGGSVRYFDANGKLLFTTPGIGGQTGAVRTVTADFNLDGVPDIVVGTGPGGASQIRILDGKDGTTELFSTAPFEAAFTGGVYVAAGDVNADGVPDVIITPDEGGGPRVDIYSGKGFGKMNSFFGIDDTSFRGGARAALADMNGDGIEDLLVAAGFGGGPRLAGYDGKALQTSGSLVRIFGDFFAFEQTLRNGVFVTSGDITGDGFADLLVGGGPGGGPRVLGFDGKALLGNQYVTVANFFAGDPNDRTGVRITVKDLDGDNRGDLIATAGSRVIGYLGKNIPAEGTPPAVFDFDAGAGTSGVFVG